MMNVSVNVEWFVAVVLSTIRLGMLFWITPLDGLGRLPVRIRVLITFVLSIFLVDILNLKMAAMPSTFWQLAIAATHEIYLALVMVFGIHVAFAAFFFGGKLLDLQSGLAAAAILNPATHEQEPLFGTVLTLLAVFLFFSFDMHLLMLKGIAYSFKAVPPGGVLHGLNLALLVKQFGVVFVFGIGLVAPILATLFLIDLAVAVTARTMPQVNMYFVVLPLKVFVVLVVTSLSLKFMVPLIESLFKGIFTYWTLVLHHG